MLTAFSSLGLLCWLYNTVMFGYLASSDLSTKNERLIGTIGVPVSLGMVALQTVSICVLNGLLGSTMKHVPHAVLFVVLLALSIGCFGLCAWGSLFREPALGDGPAFGLFMFGGVTGFLACAMGDLLAHNLDEDKATDGSSSS